MRLLGSSFAAVLLQGTMILLVLAGLGACICVPRCLANRAGKRRRGDAKGGWIGLTQLGGSRTAED